MNDQRAPDARLGTILGIWREVLECPAHLLGPDSHFLLLGGDSLHMLRVLARVRERLGAKLELRDFAQFVTPRRMAACCTSAAAVVMRPSAQRVNEALGSFTASEGQTGLWLAEQLSGNRGVYNTAAVVHLQGRLRVPALQRALSLLLKHHEILRGCLRLDPQSRNLIVQISPQTDVVLVAEPLCAPRLEQRLRELAARPYALDSGPLWRFELLRTEPACWHLMLGMHHSITDGWSYTVLLRELANYYNELCCDWHWLPYGVDQEFRAWRAVEIRDRSRSLEWWRAALAGADKSESLPPLHAQRGPFPMEVLELAVPDSLVTGLKSVAQEAGVTPAALLLLATRLALCDLTGLREICIAMPANLRSSSAQECGVGYFVNLLVLRDCVDPNEERCSALRRTQLSLLAALDHKEPSFTTLVRELRPHLLPSGNAWCDVMFAYQSLPAAISEFAGLDASIDYVAPRWGQFPLKVEFICRKSDWLCRVEHVQTIRAFASPLLTAVFDRINDLARPRFQPR